MGHDICMSLGLHDMKNNVVFITVLSIVMAKFYFDILSNHCNIQYVLLNLNKI